MIQYLLGGALLLGTAYLNAKENMSSSSDDYKNMSAEEKFNSLKEGTENWATKEVEKQKMNLKAQLKNRSDKEILNGLKNLDESDWRYEVVEEIALERGIL